MSSKESPSKSRGTSPNLGSGGGAGADPWLPLLANLPLSRTEREVVRRYEGDPTGRSFLPVADILRAHRLIDESLELLTQGLDRHPGFAVARVVLARELLGKGLATESWRVLEESPTPLKENLLAQKLRLKLALLLGLEAEAGAIHRHLKAHQMLDAELKRLGDLFEVSGLGAARDQLVKEYEERGVALALPEAPATAEDRGTFGAPSRDLLDPNRREAPDEAHLGGEARPAFPVEPPPATASAFYQDDRIEDDPAIAGFHVVALDEIFRPGDQGGLTGKVGEGPELDSTTLADIYLRQGHYGRALAVYRRLLRMAPHNDYLRRRVAETSRLEREQRDVDLTVDPAVVDKMETVEILDRQIKFYNALLTRLT